MLKYYDYFDNETRDIPKNNPWPFEANEKYYKLNGGDAVNNEDYNTAANYDIQIAAVRSERTSKLYNCDWSQLMDSPLTELQKTNWATYRQSLRDLPANLTDLDTIKNMTWPTIPN